VTLRLRPLRDDEFDDWAAEGRRWYAQDMVDHGEMEREAAERKAEHDAASTLPQRLATPGMHVLALESVETGERVGSVWFAEREAPFEGREAFLYSVWVDERHRGRGFGRQAMLLLEQEVRALGLDRIRLNVFGGNEAARSLYRSLGYVESAVLMVKRL